MKIDPVIWREIRRGGPIFVIVVVIIVLTLMVSYSTIAPIIGAFLIVVLGLLFLGKDHDAEDE